MVFPPVFGPTLFQTVDIPMICGKSTMIILIGMRNSRIYRWVGYGHITPILHVICRKIRNKYESEDKFV